MDHIKIFRNQNGNGLLNSITEIRKQNDSFNITKENEFWPRILHPVKASAKPVYQAKIKYHTCVKIKPRQF